MGDRNPNTPLRMRTRGNGARKAEVDTHVSGNIARDGFDRLAHRRHPGEEPDQPDGPFPMFGGGQDDKTINPRVGEREYRYPPYAPED